MNWSHRSFLALGAACLILLTACEYWYGSRRTVELNTPLPENCILRSLASIEDIDPATIRQTHWEDGTNIFYWVARKDVTYTSGFVSLSPETTKGIILTLDSGLINNPIEENLQYGRKILDAVYANFRMFCPNVPDPSVVEERCHRLIGFNKCS